MLTAWEARVKTKAALRAERAAIRAREREARRELKAALRQWFKDTGDFIAMRADAGQNYITKDVRNEIKGAAIDRLAELGYEIEDRGGQLMVSW